MTPVNTDIFSDEIFYFAEKTHLMKTSYSPVFLFDRVTSQGQCNRNKKSGLWEAYITVGHNRVFIGSKGDREEAMKLLWSRKSEASSYDIGF